MFLRTLLFAVAISSAVFAAPPRQWDARDLSVVDGDTAWVTLDLGFRVSIRQKVRLADVDSPEKSTQAGESVKAVVAKWISDRPKGVIAQFIRSDKYDDRFDGDLIDAKGESLKGYLKKHGLVRDAKGGKRAPWTEEDLAAVEKSCRELLGEK